MRDKIIITIGREFGSGGHEIGEKLAKSLGIPFYDKELIQLAAKQSGMSQEILSEIDENATNSLLYALSTGAFLMGTRFSPISDTPLNDKLFFIQFDMIKKAAEQGSCVIVGRCADYVLQDHPDSVHIFIHADMHAKIDRIAKKYDLSRDKAKDMIIKTDKKRTSYYNYYADTKWDTISNYDLCINSTTIGIDNAVEIIKSFAKMHENSAL